MRVLLLNSNYEPLQFIEDRRGIKLIFKDKVEVISNWDQEINTGCSMNYPSILRLKNKVPQIFLRSVFSRVAIIRRDQQSCQYCSKKLQGAEITIDHVLPKAQGGKSTFSNCVVACKPCNNRKADKTPQQVNMPLIKEPIDPKYFLSLKDFHSKTNKDTEEWNKSWNDYLT